MDEDQYENSYGNGNTSILSFSATYAGENTRHINETVELSKTNQGYREFYLILDNRDTPLTPNDAMPTGTITLNLNIEIMTSYLID